MKPNSITMGEKIFNFVFIFLASAGLGYAAMNQFILNKPNTTLLITMICLFVVSIASWKRKNTK